MAVQCTYIISRWVLGYIISVTIVLILHMHRDTYMNEKLIREYGARAIPIYKLNNSLNSPQEQNNMKNMPQEQI